MTQVDDRADFYAKAMVTKSLDFYRMRGRMRRWRCSAVVGWLVAAFFGIVLFAILLASIGTSS